MSLPEGHAGLAAGRELSRAGELSECGEAMSSEIVLVPKIEMDRERPLPLPGGEVCSKGDLPPAGRQRLGTYNAQPQPYPKLP